MQIPNYTSPEEQEYIRYRHIQQPLPYFAPGELEKVENFEIARSEGFYGWLIHHRLGESIPRWQLIAEERYYLRPAEELIFLTASMHRKIHGTGKPCAPPDDVNPMYVKAVHRYRQLLIRISEGADIPYVDERFLAEFCRRTHREMPQGLKRKGINARVDHNLAICMKLIEDGFLELDTRIQQRNRIIRFLRSAGEYAPSHVRAIERMLLLDKELLKMNNGVAILLPYTESERVSIRRDSHRIHYDKANRNRAEVIKKKMANEEKLTSAERKFKSLHKELFHEERLSDEPVR
jgi:hypothetical protein